jgi:hypothetical protein
LKKEEGDVVGWEIWRSSALKGIQKGIHLNFLGAMKLWPLTILKVILTKTRIPFSKGVHGHSIVKMRGRVRFEKARIPTVKRAA